MAYYLTIKDKNEYKLLDISLLEEFTRISKFKENSYSLDEIDFFTSKFENEATLKNKLFTRGIITSDDIIKDISIRRKTKGKLEKVTHGLVYNNMKKYLDETYLRMKLLELQNDKVFLKKLYTYYRNSHSNQESLSMIRALLLGYSERDINMYNALNLFFTKEVYSEDKTTGEIKIKYKSLHDLAMFIYNYLDKKDKNEIELEMREMARINELNTLKNSLNNPSVHVKKRVLKKRIELEGQITFFD